MPVVVLASPKGGCGKSTAAIILATEMAAAGAQVTLLDCDPNKSVIMWSERSPLPPRVNVVAVEGVDRLASAIKAADGLGRIVVVDLEGVATALMARAVAHADLALIPMRMTTLDVAVGLRALQLVRAEAKAANKAIKYAIVESMASAVPTVEARQMRAQIKAAGVDMISPPLLTRAAFSALYAAGGDLRSPAYDGIGKIDAARDNASAFAMAIYRRLAS